MSKHGYPAEATVAFGDIKADEVDGNIITSRTPADLPQYMKAIIEFLSQ